jgi:hypothetical protein
VADIAMNWLVAQGVSESSGGKPSRIDLDAATEQPAPDNPS